MTFNPFITDGYTGRVPLTACPVCFTKLDAVTNVTSKEKPEPGDFTVCLSCRAVLRFDKNLKLEKSSLLDVPVNLRYAFAKMLRIMETMPLRKKE